MIATQDVEKDARALAKQWYWKQMVNPYRQLYPFYAPGRLTIAEKGPEGFSLADARRLGPNWTEDEAQRHLAQNVLPTTPYLTEEGRQSHEDR